MNEYIKSLKEAGKVLRNEKTSSTDEFLIKKKEFLSFKTTTDQITSAQGPVTN